MKVAQKVLSICSKSKGGYYFHDPVDPSKYGIDDYFDIIEQPMDFGTIKKKLTFNVYHNVQEFSYDMKLVFDNCVKYNGVENQIAKLAIEIKNLFEENMKQTGFMNWFDSHLFYRFLWGRGIFQMFSNLERYLIN